MSSISARIAGILRCRGIAAAAAAMLTIAGCGFQPIHGNQSAASGEGLANFDIGLIADRTGQMMRNELLQQMQPRGAVPAPRFGLNVALTETLTDLAIRKDEVATRANLTLTAVFTVVSRADGSPLLTGRARSVNSYNILTSDFATLSARADARKRAVRQLARYIRERLAVWLVQTGGRPVAK
jgi:LPS-assembly lipoprotein